MSKDIKIAIVAVTDEARNLLMIRRVKSDGDDNSMKWEFPAGHIDPGEIPAVAAVREVKEETGLDIFLLPHGIIIPTKKGKAAYYLGLVQGGGVKPKIKLAEDEHDKHLWVSPENFDKVKPTHKRMKENLIDLLTHISEELQVPERVAQRIISTWDYWSLARQYSKIRREASQSSGTRKEKHMKKSRRVQAQETGSSDRAYMLPGPGEELKEAILVGDEVEIFLKRHMNGDGKTPEPSISGVVEKRDRNTIWVRQDGDEEEQILPVNWNDRGEWSFMRVYRGADQVVHYVSGNPYDEDSKEVSKAKGLGLILESAPPTRYEAVWALMRGETPDLDRSMGQAPESMDVVAPTCKPKPGTPPILTQVKDVIRSHSFEPEIVDYLGKGRVMILTQDSDMKKELIKVLEKHGKKVESSRRGYLIVRQGNSLSTMGTTTVPIATDDDLMLLTRRKRERDLKGQRRQQGRQSALPDAPITPQQAGIGQTGQQGAGASLPVMSLVPQGVPLTDQQAQQAQQGAQQAQPGAQQAGQAGIPPGGTKLTKPVTNYVIPNSGDQAKMFMGKYGTMPKKTLPGGATQVNPNQQQSKQIGMDQSKNPLMKAPKAASRSSIIRVARSLAQSLRDQEYNNSSHYISQLREMGVKESSIARSSIASRKSWGHLHQYLESTGEFENSRIARTASRLAPDL